jgi:hypothetical protein
MERLLKLDEQEIQSIIDMIQQASDFSHPTSNLVSRREDPLQVLLAGTEQSTVKHLITTSPIWFTHVLSVPDKISWDNILAADILRIRLWSVDDGDILIAETNSHFFELTTEQKALLPVDQYIRWELRDAKKESMLVRGIFRILPPLQANLIIQYTNTLNDNMQGTNYDLKFADCCMHWLLYNDLLQKFSQPEPDTITENIVQSRLQAHVFTKMHDELCRRQMAKPEGSWAALKANEYVGEFYRCLTRLEH